MNIETEKILLNQIVERRKDLFTVEDNIIIPDVKPDILAIVTTSPNLYVYRKELINGKIKIDGGIQVDTLYISDDENNNTRALHNSIDFSKTIDIENLSDDNFNFSCELNVKNVEPKILNGRKLSIKINIEYNIIVYSNKETQFIKSINDMENVQRINELINVSAMKSRGETICSAKDTISIEENLADILCYNISTINREEKVSYNKLLSKADCSINLLYLTEDEQLKELSTKIPIMGFIDMPGISEDELIETSYEIRNINIKPDNVNNNAISIDVEFSITSSTFEERTLDLIQDLYSPEEEITLSQERAILEQNRKSVSDLCNVCEKINIPDAKDNKIYIANVTKNNISNKILDNSVSYEGNISVDFIFESNNTGRLEQRNQSFDFKHNMQIDGLVRDTEVNTNIEINKSELKVLSDGSTELNIELSFRADMFSRTSVNLINDVKVEETNPNSKQTSLVIYFIKEGDTLWKIAKRFKTTVDEIADVNSIDNLDKLNVGNQLFIPRHVSAKTY